MREIKWEKMPDFICWNRVKTLRKHLKLSQMKVAAGAGISMPTLWSIESGFDEKTTKETKQKIADFFDCNIDDIFPAEMVGNEPREQPKEKTIGKMQFFVTDKNGKK